MAILDRTIADLNQPRGQPVDFEKVMTQLLNVNSKSEGQQPLEHH